MYVSFYKEESRNRMQLSFFFAFFLNKLLVVFNTPISHSEIRHSVEDWSQIYQLLTMALSRTLEL